MMRVLALALCGALVCIAQSQSIVFKNVTVIDPGSGQARSGRDVVITGKRIVQVGLTGATRIPRGAQVIDASRKFLIPGLWDMHVHTFFGDTEAAAKEVTLPLLIANGITGVRDMGSNPEPVLLARQDIESQRLLGPHMVVAGPMLDGPKVQFPASLPIVTADDGRRAVGVLKTRGVDFIKIQSNVPREAYFAIADECRKQHIPFVGHVPDAVRGSEAVREGQRSFEHLIGIFEGSSTVEDQLLKGPKSPGRFLETYDAKREAVLIQLLARRRVWQCPTLYWERGQWLVDAIDVSRDPAAQDMPVSWREKVWPKWAAGIMKDMDTDPLGVRERFVEHELGIVKRLHAAGVPFLAGTDSPAGVDVVPGVSLHRELQRLVAGGLSPLEALQTATTNPAKFLGKQSDFGAVERGKMADLVVLDANPLEDIGNTQKIWGVVSAGRYFSRERLDQMLEEIRQKSRRM